MIWTVKNINTKKKFAFPAVDMLSTFHVALCRKCKLPGSLERALLGGIIECFTYLFIFFKHAPSVKDLPLDSDPHQNNPRPAFLTLHSNRVESALKLEEANKNLAVECLPFLLVFAHCPWGPNLHRQMHRKSWKGCSREQRGFKLEYVHGIEECIHSPP